MTAPAADPQVSASDPRASVFVTANAGSGKTSTLVKRVARLLLDKAPPEAILCVTYTKAAAAEMQRRLYEELGGWAVARDEALAGKLAELDEPHRELPVARALFAKALETPGGLKIQTIHAFCEKLLRRFPLEAGVAPGFQVLEASAAAKVSAKARDDLARFALEDGDGLLGKAYARFSVELSWPDFNAMFATFEARRAAIADYVEACEARDGVAADIWGRCGFDEQRRTADIEAEAAASIDWGGWRRAREALAASGAADQAIAAAMRPIGPGSTFMDIWACFRTQAGTPRAKLGAKAVDAGVRAWLVETQDRLGEAAALIKAARIAEDTLNAITLARAYGALYRAAKVQSGGLDFGDLIERTHQLLTVKADAAWVLYKLDGGIDHVLLDEAQDTAPEQWAILRALTGEFFAGAGRPVPGRKDRTAFAVGDEKQSIYSFQGARPEQFDAEGRRFQALVRGAGQSFRHVPLLESWRSTAPVLSFVDAVCADPQVLAALRPTAPGGASAGVPIVHIARREAGPGCVDPGCVDLWPLEESEPSDEPDWWEPVDQEPKQSANRKLAGRIARAIKATVAAGEAVFDKQARLWRPAAYGDFLILVRRRGTLFHEIIRALKREGVAVGGADRLRLSDHVVFQDLVALGRFALFPTDDLTLAALLRGPFCEVGEEDLFDLAHGRAEPLWGVLNRRADDRAAWASARDILAWAIGEAALRAPFDFYGRVLSRLDGEGRSMRARLLTRLGREAEDALDAFMGEALASEQRGALSLERLLAELAASEIEVKREQEDSSGRPGGEVRVMTAHGAKGLEAPIVFLPDTTTKVTVSGGPLLDAEGGGFLWAPRKGDDCLASDLARSDRERAGQEESLRLLYVALTRARDRLVICGVKTLDRYRQGSWQDFAARAFERPEVAARTREWVQDGMQIQRFGPDPEILIAAARSAPAVASLPPWARRFAPAEPVSQRYASPSTLAESERGPAPSPLAAREGLGRYRRGVLIHRLLQLLPDLAVEKWAAAARTLLEREDDLTLAQREEMAAAALGVLGDPRFAAVFGPGSRAEAAIAGGSPELPPGLAVSGRVDRLVIAPGRVLVADFKTNRPAPARIEDADPAYLVQMAVYAAVLREVFPGRTVEAALVWTDGPKLMPVPENIIDQTLARLRAEG
jgi:ATP-dependent helicase/nuclease subunit A